MVTVKSPWLRYHVRYYWAWRVAGTVLGAVAVLLFWRGDIARGFTALFMAVTYGLLIPLNIASTFRLGYWAGAQDGLTANVTGDRRNLRPDLDPRDAEDEARRYED